MIVDLALRDTYGMYTSSVVSDLSLIYFCRWIKTSVRCCTIAFGGISSRCAGARLDRRFDPDI
jgi:hypothetical protein